MAHRGVSETVTCRGIDAPPGPEPATVPGMSAAWVVCVDGPKAGQVWPVEDVDETGGLRFQGTFGAPDAWYRLDKDGEPVTTDKGPALPANYVGEHPA